MVLRLSFSNNSAQRHRCFVLWLRNWTVGLRNTDHCVKNAIFLADGFVPTVKCGRSVELVQNDKQCGYD